MIASVKDVGKTSKRGPGLTHKTKSRLAYCDNVLFGPYSQIESTACLNFVDVSLISSYFLFTSL